MWPVRPEIPSSAIVLRRLEHIIYNYRKPRYRPADAAIINLQARRSRILSQRAFDVD